MYTKHATALVSTYRASGVVQSTGPRIQDRMGDKAYDPPPLSSKGKIATLSSPNSLNPPKRSPVFATKSPRFTSTRTYGGYDARYSHTNLRDPFEGAHPHMYQGNKSYYSACKWMEAHAQSTCTVTTTLLLAYPFLSLTTFLPLLPSQTTPMR